MQNTQTTKTEAVRDAKTGRVDSMATDAKMQAEKEANRKKWQDAWEALKTAGEKNEDVKKALMTLRPSLYGIGGGGGGGQRNTVKYSFFKDVIEKKQIHEDEVFKLYKMGRKEVADFLKWKLKTSPVAERMWVSFNAETGMYKLEGKGEEVPKTYKGYVPPKTEESEFAKQI